MNMNMIMIIIMLMHPNNNNNSNNLPNQDGRCLTHHQQLSSRSSNHNTIHMRAFEMWRISLLSGGDWTRLHIPKIKLVTPLKKLLRKVRRWWEIKTADIIQETRKLQIRHKGGSLRDQPIMQTTLAQNQTHHETQLKASRDVAMATVAKAKLLLWELKSMKVDLAVCFCSPQWFLLSCYLFMCL
ncbi:hypothetical protein QYF36_009743 [Acer negundo]|nr:hypothetical protein QYF36_009743 [Acer negundo]